MMKLLRHIPNTLTCANLICGCIGIVFTFIKGPLSGAWFVWAACVFDFLDGFSARLLKASSPIGKELDSLADVVSFGALPAMVMYQLLNEATLNYSLDGAWGYYLPFFAFSITAFSALRLAKFNIDENQSESFIGLPTPANALLITSLPYLVSPFNFIISSEWSLIVITILSSLILVAPIRLFALKMKSLQWKDNKVQFTFIAISVLLLAFWQAAALPFVILLYILASLIKNWTRI